MTTTDMPPTDLPPTDLPPTEAPPRLLRRSRSDRFGAGVCGGLGEYFRVDPILFRVLFAVAALFGGSGVLAYLLAWAVIPETGTQVAPLDGWVHKLRHHRVPVWVVAVGIGAVLWLAAFSWWSPGPFVPVVAVVVVLVVLLNRRDLQGTATTVDLHKTGPSSSVPTSRGRRDSMRAWLDESKRAARARRRRALPVKVAALGGMAAVLVVLAAIDAVSGVPIVAYFWTMAGFVTVGLLAGLVLRRTPWSIITLLPLSLAGVLAFAGSHAALHDGVGQKSWGPAQLSSQYRLCVGQATLNLRHLSAVNTVATTTRVTAGAGQVRILLPARANIEVRANVHIGQIEFSGRGDGLQQATNAGVGAAQTFLPPDGATGPRIVVDVHVADGQIVVERS